MFGDEIPGGGEARVCSNWSEEVTSARSRATTAISNQESTKRIRQALGYWK